MATNRIEDRAASPAALVVAAIVPCIAEEAARLAYRRWSAVPGPDRC